MRKTRIVATLGPASNTNDVIRQMIEAGMDVSRINFSHGTYETHGETIRVLKEVREEMGVPVALMLDTKGPEIRIKTFGTDIITLTQGDKFTLTTTDIVGDQTRVSVTYTDLPKDLKIGSRVLIDDGLIELKVLELTDTDIICEVINSGTLSSRKGVNVPDVYVNLPSITEKDIEDLKFGIENGFDYIAASFIRSANDIIKIRTVLEENGGGNIRIIAKIESRDGVNNLDSILEVADGIMVARGDLGVEIPPEEVPIVQKLLINKANALGKPVITATQMLESMVHNPRPTRAEANDVANAIYDGTDAIMLSGETAQGKYPVGAIQMMNRIALTTEASINYTDIMRQHYANTQTNMTNAMGYAACTTAANLDAACIVAVTESGFTPKMISKYRPQAPIVALSSDKELLRQLNLTWNCLPVFTEDLEKNSDIFELSMEKAVKTGLANDGDAVIIAGGTPVGVAVKTNTLKVSIVGDVIARGEGYGDNVVSGKAVVIKVVEDTKKSFKSGDILVTTKATKEMLPLINKAAALVVGSWENVDNSYAEKTCRELNLPLIVCKDKVIDLISGHSMVTVDTQKGFVYNGVRNTK